MLIPHFPSHQRLHCTTSMLIFLFYKAKEFNCQLIFSSMLLALRPSKSILLWNLFDIFSTKERKRYPSKNYDYFFPSCILNGAKKIQFLRSTVFYWFKEAKRDLQDNTKYFEWKHPKEAFGTRFIYLIGAWPGFIIKAHKDVCINDWKLWFTQEIDELLFACHCQSHAADDFDFSS